MVGERSNDKWKEIGGLLTHPADAVKSSTTTSNKSMSVASVATPIACSWAPEYWFVSSYLWRPSRWCLCHLLALRYPVQLLRRPIPTQGTFPAVQQTEHPISIKSRMNAEARALLSIDPRVYRNWSLHYRSGWWHESDFPHTFIMSEGLSISVWSIETVGDAKALKKVASLTLPKVSSHLSVSWRLSGGHALKSLSPESVSRHCSSYYASCSHFTPRHWRLCWMGRHHHLGLAGGSSNLSLQLYAQERTKEGLEKKQRSVGEEAERNSRYQFIRLFF